MPPKLPRAAWLAVPLAGLLYFYRLGAAGLLGPDEPRYASIGREMARSGDWITPRLWGQPWFEKPALLYWMEAAAFRLGLGPEMAPRLPVAALAVAFLAFYWWILRREFGSRAACMATLILGTSGAWIVASQIGVTDLPLAATFSAAMLLALPWIARRETLLLPLAAALLGLAVLAKGLVPAALAFPLFWRKAAWRDLLRPRVALPFLAVALPWYGLCYLRNGRVFLVEFFWQHHFERMVSPALMHVQPWWFYLPVMLVSLLPWTPLLVLLGGRAAYRDPRRLFLLAWLLFGLAFFSIATNKLPGYLLPLLPAAAALMGLALAESAGARGWLALSAGLLVVFPMAAPILPAAVADGLSRAPRPAFDWAWLLPVGSGCRRVGARGAIAPHGGRRGDCRGRRGRNRLRQVRRHARPGSRRVGPFAVARGGESRRPDLRRPDQSQLALRAELLLRQPSSRVLRRGPAMVDPPGSRGASVGGSGPSAHGAKRGPD